MTKTFCDRCGAEIVEGSKRTPYRCDFHPISCLVEGERKHLQLCEDCAVVVGVAIHKAMEK